MQNGYGAVVARIFNAKNDLVFDGVTRFSYVHSELVDDASYFTIETADLTLVDHPDLQEGKMLKVVWGYLPEDLTSRQVWIWDIVPTFTTQGLRIEITAYCKAAYLKLNSSQKVWEDTSLTDMVDDIAEQYGLTVDQDGIEAQDQSADPAKFTHVITGSSSPAILDGKTGKQTVARDNTTFIKDYAFRTYKEGEAIPQANKSDRGIIDAMVNQEPVDNMFVSGRDDKLLIQRRNLNQKPFKTYVFKQEPGYLLSFSPATKNSEAEKGAIANISSGWDEEEKAFIQSEVGRPQSGAGVMGDMIELTFEQLQREQVLKENDNPFDRPISIAGMAQEEYDGVDAAGNPQFKKVFTEKLDSTKKAFIYIKKTGTRPSQVVFNGKKGAFASAAIDGVGRIETMGVVIKDPKEYVHSIEKTPTAIVGTGVNRQSQKELDLHTAEGTMVGDTQLRSSRVISVLGVGKKYSGNYYVTHVRHDITTENGFICTVKAFRTGTNNIGSEITNKVDANDLGLNKNNITGLPNDGTNELVKVPVIKD